MQSSNFHKAIMRRVYTIYLLKSVAQPLIFELALMSAFIGVASFYISLQSVLENIYAQEDTLAMGKYFIGALLSTRIIVQTIAAGAFIALVVFVYDSIRRVRRAMQYRTQ